MVSVVFVPLFLIVLFTCCAAQTPKAEAPKGETILKLQNAKLPPVTFSHATHVEKKGIACIACHHRDPGQPQACTSCHKQEAQGKTLSAKDAFHQNCQTCHKEQEKVSKTRLPTRCNDCHKK